MRGLMILGLVLILAGCGRNAANPQGSSSGGGWHGGDRHLDEAEKS